MAAEVVFDTTKTVRKCCDLEKGLELIPDTPIWDPAVAASAGAGFAGVLGAIVVAVTFQISFTGKARGGDDDVNLCIRSEMVAPLLRH